MTVKIAINGFGRIGRLVLRALHESGNITTTADTIDIGHGPIKVTAERDPTKLPWKELGVELVMECTGIFTKREQAEMHIKAGAKRVLISAPAEGADLTVVYGVNHDQLKPSHTIVSNATCTTNCLAPVA